jgi:hypothetical protein
MEYSLETAMTRLLLALTVLLFAFGVFATQPAAATCNNLVTCYAYLPEHSYPDPSWQYSHQCCDLEDHTTIWNVYIDFRGRWHLVGSNIPPLQWEGDEPQAQIDPADPGSRP